MSGREHEERWFDELAAHALGSLAAGEQEAVERHLAGCEGCRERLRWLQPAVDMLPATVPQEQPPPALRDRIMATVEQEAGRERRAAVVAAPRPSRLSGLLAGLSLRPALASLGVALLVAAGVGGYAFHNASEPQARTYAAAPPQGGSPAEGTLTVRGDSGTLTVRNLPPAGHDRVYQAWIVRDGDVEPSSVFVLSNDGRGEASIPHGLEGAEEVMVTREPVGGSERPHESPRITAPLS